MLFLVSGVSGRGIVVLPAQRGSIFEAAVALGLNLASFGRELQLGSEYDRVKCPGAGTPFPPHIWRPWRYTWGLLETALTRKRNTLAWLNCHGAMTRLWLAPELDSLGLTTEKQGRIERWWRKNNTT